MTLDETLLFLLLSGSSDRFLGVIIFPAYQLVPIGVTFGKRFYGFAEAGYGFQYQGGRAGIGWKF